MVEESRSTDQVMEDDIIHKLGMEFNNLEEAWKFWVDYGGKIGFGVRKFNFTKSKKDGRILSYRYVCCKEGLRKPDKRDVNTINPSPETRTNCKARMGVALVEGKYRINLFIEEYNHPLHTLETVHMLASQRKLTEVQAQVIDLAEDSGLQQKDSFQLMSRQAGGRACLGFTRLDTNNYIRSKRQHGMKFGEVGALLRYFWDKVAQNTSFFHTYEVDIEEPITNVFWADPSMLIDYAIFGDVVSLDTTYSTNRHHRPLAIFSGFNHFREVVIFGAALLYDETIESFKWLLETFLLAHRGKRPQTVFTDQDKAMARALIEVLPETKHGLCSWHLMQNGIKHLSNLMKGPTHFLSDFQKCMYEYIDETEFESAWNTLLSKYSVHENSWLSSIYNVKEKWAWCYLKNSLTLGLRSTQVSESVNACIKSVTKPNLDIIQFFKQFECMVDDKRYKELECEYDSIQKRPKMFTSYPMVLQLVDIYTAPIFHLFQEQVNLFLDACITSISPRKVGEEEKEHIVIDYIVTMVGKKGKWRLCFDPNMKSVSCNCRKFETWGILCCHALKVLDANNIKEVPHQYIMKRWTKDAKSKVVHDSHGVEVQVDPKLENTRRYRDLCAIMTRLATKASVSPKICLGAQMYARLRQTSDSHVL